jgi:cell division protein FtsZ
MASQEDLHQKYSYQIKGFDERALPQSISSYGATEALEHQELVALHAAITAETLRRENFQLRQVQVKVDGADIALFTPPDTKCPLLRIPLWSSLIEIFGRDEEGELLLAFVPLTDLDPIYEKNVKEWLVNERNFAIKVTVSPVKDENNRNSEWLVEIDCRSEKSVISLAHLEENGLAHSFSIPRVVSSAKVLVVGVGSSGSNAVDYMLSNRIECASFAAFNTDVQALQRSRAPIKLQLGARCTKGLGTGSVISLGHNAAIDCTDEIVEVLQGFDMLFITTGLGGGTGTGAAPIVAAIAREMDILTVGVVTTPFSFEGRHRSEQATAGLIALKNVTDTVIAISNDRLLRTLHRTTSLTQAFNAVDEVLKHSVLSILDLLTGPGIINIDFADLRVIMKGMNTSFFGVGCASGEARSLAAVERALHSPFLEDVTIKGAKGVIVKITGGMNLALGEINEIATVIRDVVDNDANIIFGAHIDDALADEIKVTLVAAGFDSIQTEELRPIECQLEICSDLTLIAEAGKLNDDRLSSYE